MSLTIDEFLDPSRFPEQLPLKNARASDAIAAAIDKARCVLAKLPAPRRVNYGPDPQQVLDIISPENSCAGLRPAVIYLHGGGWTAGYPFWCTAMAPATHAHGAILIAATYGLAPRRQWPAHRDDVFAILRWIHANADDIGVDRHRIVLAGNSAGGHLAAMAAVRSDLFEQAGLPPTPFVKAFSISGSMTARDKERAPGTTGERIYREFLADPSDDLDASPITYASRASLPIHLLHVDGDIPRIKDSNLEMFERLSACGVETSLTMLEGLDHFDTMALPNDPTNEWWVKVAETICSTRLIANGEEEQKNSYNLETERTRR